MSDRAQGVSQYRQDVLALLRQVDPDAAYRYEYCQAPERGWFWHCSAYSEHPAKYIPNRCMLRICPSCAEVLAAKARDHYRAVLEHIIERHNPKHWTLKFVTFTRSVSVNDDPGGVAREVLNDVRDCYRELWEYGGAAFWGAPGKPEDKNRLVGLIGNLEVGENGHKYHVHCIVLGPYIDQREISFMWEAFTGDVVTWVEKVNVDRAVTEVLKYVTKFTSLAPETLVKLHTALKGSRRIRSYGCFYQSHQRQEACPECKRIAHPEAEECDNAHCPECGSTMQYSRELDFERWSASQKKQRQERQMLTLARLANDLQFTEANKFAGDRGPPAQITMFSDESGDGILFPDSESGL